jgi:hypothetical protein
MKLTLTRVSCVAAAAALLVAGCESELPSAPLAESPDAVQLSMSPQEGAAQLQIPPHPHVILHNAEIRWLGENEEPVHGFLPYEILAFDRCVEMANARSVPLRAHHNRVHFGTAGQKLAMNAGHFVVPLAPFGAPWESCADLEADILGT